MRELVVARYNEDVGWLDGWESSVRVSVYNKDDGEASWRWANLPNVGREAHTYLYHIVDRYHNLSDWTVFCQANPFDHVTGGVAAINDMLNGPQEPFPRMIAPRMVRMTEWDAFGQLVHPGKWGEMYRDGVIKRSPWTLRNWFREFVGVDLPADGLVYTPGACFGVSAEALRSHPKSFYEKMLDTADHHVHPEEAYYVERAWGYLFAVTGGAK